MLLVLLVLCAGCIYSKPAEHQQYCDCGECSEACCEYARYKFSFESCFKYCLDINYEKFFDLKRACEHARIDQFDEMTDSICGENDTRCIEERNQLFDYKIDRILQDCEKMMESQSGLFCFDDCKDLKPEIMNLTVS